VSGIFVPKVIEIC